MGIIDFLFGSKQKEQERIAREKDCRLEEKKS